MSEEAEDVQTVVDRYDDNVPVLGKFPAVVLVARAVKQTPAVDPDHDGPAPLVAALFVMIAIVMIAKTLVVIRSEDVEEKAIFMDARGGESA